MAHASFHNFYLGWPLCNIKRCWQVLSWIALGSCDTKILLLIVLLCLLLFSTTPCSVFSWTMRSLNQYVLKDHYVSGAELQRCCKYNNREDKHSPYPHKYYAFILVNPPEGCQCNCCQHLLADNCKICI